MQYAELLAGKGAHLSKQELCGLLGALPFGSGAHRTGKPLVPELHPASLVMLRRIEGVTSARADIRKVAKDAFRAHVRAYAAHPAVSKSIFHVKRLHLGHLAANFGLKEAPALLGKSSGPKVRLRCAPLPAPVCAAPLTASVLRGDSGRSRSVRNGRLVDSHDHEDDERDEQAHDDGYLTAHARLLDDLCELSLRPSVALPTSARACLAGTSAKSAPVQMPAASLCRPHPPPGPPASSPARDSTARQHQSR
jgi:hypothetical protein